MPSLSILIKPVSQLCNMHCDYCFYCDEAKNRSKTSFGQMDESTLKNIIRKTLPHSEHSITYAYQGGEPTLRGLDFFQSAVKYQKQYNRQQIQVQNVLQTNGYALDDSWCEFFKKHNFLIGISIDGTPETHNTYRHSQSGDKTYDRIFHSTTLLDKYQVDYNILTVVNQKVASNIKNIYHHYKSNNWKYQQYIACLDPLNVEKGTYPYSLTPNQYGVFLTTLFDLWYEDLQTNTQPYIRQFENYVGILNGFTPESCEQLGICGIQIVAEADGSVFPCDFYALDGYSLGNFNEDRLHTIDNKRVEIGFIERSLNISETCKNCEYFTLCRGGCQRNRDFDETSNTYHNYFCTSYKMFFSNCFNRLKNIKL